ncbi:hypothetical protein SBRCBS47491_010168 [Sporothrix bragantina]|uniref:Beta-lactamase-related domain-containing protein n=1 Tax=Sporothrix bragantina TaxID=671064 RepID=A0ABP0D0A8_9PEZI
MATTPDIHNDPRVLAALEEARRRGENGLAVAAYYKGKLVVDSFAGEADPETGRVVDADTIFPVFSVTKGITALAVHMQVERGLVGLHVPVCKYWPAFAANGKDTITVEQVLMHRSGIPQMPEGVTPELMGDWDWMIKHIENFTPAFPPGKVNAYHVLVWGWIAGEIVRRTDPAGRSFQDFVYEEICKPLGVNDFYLGVPDSELHRVAKLSGGDTAPYVDNFNISPSVVFPGSTVHNQRVVQQCVDPGAGAITTAGAVARIFAMLAGFGELDGVRFLSAERVRSFLEPREGVRDPDKVVMIPTWFGRAGYFIGGEPVGSTPLLGSNREAIYSPGAGGSYAWADLRNNVAVAICHNNMDMGTVHEPELTFMPIVRAVQAVIDDYKTKE